MRGITKACVVCAVAAIALAPAPARADGYFSPWIGVNAVDRTDEGHTTFGATMGYMGAGVFGFEADFGFSPNFFGGSDLGLEKTNGLTAMGNAIFGIPVGGTHGAGIRPFVTGGFGLIRTHGETALDESRSSNDPGYNLGGGMMGFFSDHIGLRGDIRYFRTLQDLDLGFDPNFTPGQLHFWRVSGGITFR